MPASAKQKRTGDSELRYLVQRALHKLCQPLSGVSFCVELSAMKTAAEDLREALDDAGKEAERAIMIVEIFRDLVEADDPPAVVETFDVAEALRSAASDAESFAAPKEQALELKGLSEKTIDNDAPRFSNVFAQIIQNCCQESPEGSPISVTLEAGKSGVLISIEDGGDAIDLAAEAAEIFHAALDAPKSPRIQLQVAARHIRSMGGNAVSKQNGKRRLIEIQLPLSIPRPKSL